VHELLAEGGYPALTMDAVAARAGVGKAAIYRRHASKAEMVFAVTVHGLELSAPPDTGALRTDVEAALTDIHARLESPAIMRDAPLFIAELGANPELSQRFRDTLMAAELACVVELLDRAAARGELRDRPDPAKVHSLMLGSVFAWRFMLRRELTAALVPELAAMIAGGLTAEQGSSDGP